MAATVLASAEAAVHWLQPRHPGALRTDSRAVRPGDAFIAWPGHAQDGRAFVPGALRAGAAACLVEADGADGFGIDWGDPRVAALPHLKAATGAIADAWFGHPSRGLDVLAVTGTNGKTSTAWWCAQALTALGRRCGVVGTLGVGEPPRVLAADAPAPLQPTGLTTPDPVLLHAAFAGFAAQGFAACALEASSIGLTEHRLAGTAIDVALFTNLTQDHLDFHGSMAAYWAAKRSLFAWPGLRAAVVNVDDPHGATLAAELQHADGADAIDLWTVARSGPARLVAGALHYADGGLGFDVHEGGQSVPVRSVLVGDYNASNLLVVIGGLRALGVPLDAAAEVVRGLAPVPGRLQRLSGGDVDVVVDYAHTPDALTQVLQALRPLAAGRRGALVCVFGCGGNRDPGKRPLMGAVAVRGADRVVLTSDNPRDEAPALILAQIAGGAAPHGAVQIIEDRHDAIAFAVATAGAGDVVLLAGKGHEAHQEIAGIRRPFSDEAEARIALARRAGAGAAR